MTTPAPSKMGSTARSAQALAQNPPRFVITPSASRPPYLAELVRLLYQEVASFGEVEVFELAPVSGGPRALTLDRDSQKDEIHL